MPLFVDGVEIEELYVDGVQQEELFVDGIQVFQAFSHQFTVSLIVGNLFGFLVDTVGAMVPGMFEGIEIFTLTGNIFNKNINIAFTGNAQIPGITTLQLTLYSSGDSVNMVWDGESYKAIDTAVADEIGANDGNTIPILIESIS